MPPFSLVETATYNVPVEVSMTGVLLMLISGEIRALAGLEIVVTPAEGLMKLCFQKGEAVLPSASNA